MLNTKLNFEGKKKQSMFQILEDYKEGNSGGGFYCLTAQLLSEDRKVSLFVRDSNSQL
jgi:hypothetical protein